MFWFSLAVNGKCGNSTISVFFNAKTLFMLRKQCAAASYTGHKTVIISPSIGIYLVSVFLYFFMNSHLFYLHSKRQPKLKNVLFFGMLTSSNIFSLFPMPERVAPQSNRFNSFSVYSSLAISVLVKISPFMLSLNL